MFWNIRLMRKKSRAFFNLGLKIFKRRCNIKIIRIINNKIQIKLIKMFSLKNWIKSITSVSCSQRIQSLKRKMKSCKLRSRMTIRKIWQKQRKCLLSWISPIRKNKKRSKSPWNPHKKNSKAPKQIKMQVIYKKGTPQIKRVVNYKIKLKERNKKTKASKIRRMVIHHLRNKCRIGSGIKQNRWKSIKRTTLIWMTAEHQKESPKNTRKTDQPN